MKISTFFTDPENAKYIIGVILIIAAIGYFTSKKKKDPVKYNDIEIPNSAVYNKASDNSVFQVENYLKSRHKSYRPLQWWPVQEAHIEEGKYMVTHRYRADKVVYNQVFFLDSLGNVTIVK